MHVLLFQIMALPAIVIGFAMLVAIAKWILGPISHAAGLLQAPMRFRLSDFVWLVVQFQVVLAACAQGIDIEDVFGFGITLTFLFLATTAMWMGAVSCVSKAGVVHPWRRGIFVLCQLPLTLTFMFAIPICLGAGLLRSLQFAMSRESLLNEVTGLQVVGLFAASIIMGIASWGMRYVSIWVLEDSAWAKEQMPDSHQPIIAFEESVLASPPPGHAVARLPTVPLT